MARPAFFTRNGGGYGPAYAGIGRYANNARNGRFGPGFIGFRYPNYLDFGFGPLFWDDGFDSFPYAWDNSGAYGYGAGAGVDDAGVSYPDQPPDSGGPGVATPYPAAPSEQMLQAPYVAAASASPQPADEDPITLIYKDGRPPEQVRNYALTRTAIYITGRRMREIPLDELDLPATQRVNHAAGVDFRLP